ncbi:hypothetical protein HanIR_Chr09g0439661 [Helianthus annuus]|nr:hypothetical protein HanIR_Chr09g0439661 [Helianthus annuus]
MSRNLNFSTNVVNPFIECLTFLEFRTFVKVMSLIRKEILKLFFRCVFSVKACLGRNNYATSLFIGGLKPEIGGWVKLFGPKTLEDAYEKAKNHVNFLTILEGNKKLRKVGGQFFSEIEIQFDESVKGVEILEPINVYEKGNDIQETTGQDSCDNEDAKENGHEKSSLIQNGCIEVEEIKEILDDSSDFEELVNEMKKDVMEP